MAAIGGCGITKMPAELFSLLGEDLIRTDMGRLTMTCHQLALSCLHASPSRIFTICSKESTYQFVMHSLKDCADDLKLAAAVIFLREGRTIDACERLFGKAIAALAVDIADAIIKEAWAVEERPYMRDSAAALCILAAFGEEAFLKANRKNHLLFWYAVQQPGWGPYLEHAAEEIKEDKEIAYLAVKECAMSYLHVEGDAAIDPAIVAEVHKALQLP